MQGEFPSIAGFNTLDENSYNTGKNLERSRVDSQYGAGSRVEDKCQEGKVECIQ